jgi:hypothetical protein
LFSQDVQAIGRAPVNYGIFVPEATLTGQMVSGEIIIVDPASVRKQGGRRDQRATDTTFLIWFQRASTCFTTPDLAAPSSAEHASSSAEKHFSSTLQL